ncbi:CHAD domain-containing protein [Paracoccus salsus]|uniref:CHAD domain-containing protein n=1 Tax=Paracoccus salsus TaxID=2911061 RepID=UPI001F36A616|nr:CHAD domain-containing protein [Paracoccus salsus]MCF3972169.1 CHAD domain-containing protein [Paracoccus salsus]
MSTKPAAKTMAKAAGLDPRTSGLDAFRRLLREGAAVHDARSTAILTSDDPEHVHQARVAVRRMRSLVRGFSDMLTRKTTERLTAMLVDRFRLLGPLRDADVRALALAGTEDENRASSEAAARRETLRGQLTAGKPLSLRIEIEALLHDPSCAVRGPRRQRLAAAPVGVPASRALQTAWTELLAFGPDLHALSPGERHDFRKRAKDLRYLSEFFAPLFDHDPKKMLKRISKIQDALGVVNDIDNMRAAQATQNATGLPPDADSIEKKQLKTAQKAWSRLRDANPWWCRPPWRG